MSIPAPEQQLRDEDDAARMREAGHTWAEIADHLDCTISHAKLCATAGEARAAERARRDQLSLW